MYRGFGKKRIQMNYYPNYKPKRSKSNTPHDPCHNTRNVLLGNYGEKYVKSLLRDSGYKAKKPRLKSFCGDLWTYSIQDDFSAKIEVKTALECANGQYRFCLRKENHTDCGHSDYVILLCIDKYQKHYIYVIPSEMLITQSLTISSHPTRYAGKFASFRVRGLINFDETEMVASLW